MARATTSRLPHSVDELVGLRAAHWGRESTGRQAERFGPAAQRTQRDGAIERYGMVDTGIEWLVAHSGRTIGSTSQFSEMLERAGRDYDVLVVGYVSRFARDLRTAVNARHELHEAGAALLFADERVLSSDEGSWETWARENVEAEAYSRRLGKRIREGYEAKIRDCADQGGGLVSLGFQRVGAQKLIRPDPATMPRAVRGVLRSSLYRGRLADGRPTPFDAPADTRTVEVALTHRRVRTRAGRSRPGSAVKALTASAPPR